MKISSIVAGVVGAVAVMALDSASVYPIIIALICLAYLVFVACVKWDDWMRKWNSLGFWELDYDDDDLGEVADIWEFPTKK